MYICLANIKIRKTMNQKATKERKPAKSVDLTNDEVKALKEFRKRYDTEVDAALAIGIDRNVLNRIITVKSGSEKYISKVREFLQLQTA